MAIRQRRTPYLRQTVQKTMPAVSSDLGWRIIGSLGAQAQCEFFGNTNGLVIKDPHGLVSAIPGNAIVSVTTPGATMDPTIWAFQVNFQAALPALVEIECPNGNLWIRNSAGGMLSSGIQSYQTPGSVPGDMLVTWDGYTATGCTLSLATGGLPSACINLPPIQNLTTLEFANAFSYSAPILSIDFPAGPPLMFEQLEMVAAFGDAFKNDGGWMAPFLIAAP